VSDDRPGVIYAICNPAWPTWIKVGRAEGERSDAENVMKRRLYQYNTGDPDKAYKAVVWKYAACCHTAERYAHDFLDIAEAARIARLRPPLRPKNYEFYIGTLRDLLQDELVEAVQAELRVSRPVNSDVADTARASRSVIKDLLECMAMGDERLEAAAEAVLRRLDLLEGV